MSRWIRISDSRGRDARVRMESAQGIRERAFQTSDGRQVRAERLIKSHLQTEYETLRREHPEHRELAQLLINGDPEIDLEAAGRKSGPTDRVFLDADGRLLYATSQIEVLYDSEGFEVQRREPAPMAANIDGETPLVWTGKTFNRSEAIHRFAFTRQYRLRHVDGLTFDFLFRIALELDNAASLVVIGGGPNGKDPLILERNGLPYRGFLEGRVDGEKYLLILHLTNLELSRPEEMTA
jgi:hypothetical protein